MNNMANKVDSRLVGNNLKSCMCTQSMLESDLFEEWCNKIMYSGHPLRMHRKIWEWCYISQALFERGLLNKGSRGLGFAVGQEPLPALFASYGCEILATDLDIAEAAEKGWVDSNQHSSKLEDLNKQSICPSDLFNKNVTFKAVDMNNIPTELVGFDFIWSSCSLEHLGSIDKGEEFINNALRCLKPGGIAVHTTEFNCLSNDKTVEVGSAVLFRQKDFELIEKSLINRGHRIEFDYSTGNKPLDLLVDKPPYSSTGHIKLEIDGYVSTSFGLIIQKGLTDVIDVDEINTKLQSTIIERDNLLLELEKIRNSRSYKVTAPLRTFAGVFRSIKTVLKKYLKEK